MTSRERRSEPPLCAGDRLRVSLPRGQRFGSRYSRAWLAFWQRSWPQGALRRNSAERASDCAPSTASEYSERLPRRPSRRVQCDRIGETLGHCNDARPQKRMHTERHPGRARLSAPSPPNTVRVCGSMLRALRNVLHDGRRAKFRIRLLSTPELHLVELDGDCAGPNLVPDTSHWTWPAKQGSAQPRSRSCCQPQPGPR